MEVSSSESIDLATVGDTAVAEAIPSSASRAVVEPNGAEAHQIPVAQEKLVHRLSNISLAQSMGVGLSLALADFVGMATTVYVVAQLLSWLLGGPSATVCLELGILSAALFLPMARLAGVYPALGASPIVESRQLVHSAGIALAACAAIGLYCFQSEWVYYTSTAALAFLLCVPVLPTVRYVARCALARTNWWGAPVLIYAEPYAGRELFRHLRQFPERGFRPVGLLLNPEDYWHAEMCGESIPLYDIRDAIGCATTTKATWILIDASGMKENSFVDDSITNLISAIPNRVFLPSMGLEMSVWDETQTIGSSCGVRSGNGGNDILRRACKRIFDIVFAGAGLIVGLPLLAAIAIAVRVTSPGSILFGQERLGFRGRPFTAWKFRSMFQDAEKKLEDCLASDPALRAEWEATHKLKNDPRKTPIGDFLRKTSLDELPQLWNVLIGQMSLVGPRPIVNSSSYDGRYINEYPREFAAYKSVPPGLTGLWQVSCRNNGRYEQRIYWDMYYIRNWSLWLDIYIVLRTVRTVLLREGAS